MKHLQRELEALSTMTTNETGNPAAIAASLTAGEREALRAISSKKAHSEQMVINLRDKGLVNYWPVGDRGWRDELTDLGKRVLAALATPAAADARPPVISAKEFVEQGYAEKVAAKECVVWGVRNFSQVRISRIKKYDTPNYLAYIEPFSDNFFIVKDGEPFTVTWLTPATAQPATDNGGGDDRSLRQRYRDLRMSSDHKDTFPAYDVWLERMFEIKEREFESLPKYDEYNQYCKQAWANGSAALSYGLWLSEVLAAANAELAAARERVTVCEGTAIEVYEPEKPDGIDMMNIRLTNDDLDRMIKDTQDSLKAHQTALVNTQQRLARYEYAKRYKQAASALAQDAAESEG